MLGIFSASKHSRYIFFYSKLGYGYRIDEIYHELLSDFSYEDDEFQIGHESLCRWVG